MTTTLSPREQIDRELQRLRGETSRSAVADPLAAAIVETLASNEVQEVLVPILENDATLKQVIMDPVVTMAGVAQFNFQCEWITGVSHLSEPPLVAALVEISPPRVLKVQKMAQEQRKAALTATFLPDPAEAPPSLKGMRETASNEAVALNTSLNQSFAKWAELSGIGNRLSNIRTGEIKETNTSCSTLFCFEVTSDDHIQDTQ